MSSSHWKFIKWFELRTENIRWETVCIGCAVSPLPFERSGSPNIRCYKQGLIILVYTWISIHPPDNTRTHRLGHSVMAVQWSVRMFVSSSFTLSLQAGVSPASKEAAYSLWGKEHPGNVLTHTVHQEVSMVYGEQVGFGAPHQSCYFKQSLPLPVKHCLCLNLLYLSPWPWPQCSQSH